MLFAVGFQGGDDLVVVFDEPFWTKGTQFFGVATGNPDSSAQATWWTSRLRDSGKPILKTFYGGSYMSEEKIRELGNSVGQ